MMMSVGPKIGIASNPVETAAMEGTASGAGTGDMFLQILAGMDTPLTAEGSGEAPFQLPCGVEGQENLTIKTFQKLLGVNSGDTEPSLAPGEDALTKGEADKLVEGTEAAAILSLGIAVPTPLTPPTFNEAVSAPSPAADVKATTAGAAALLAAAFAASPAAAMVAAAKGAVSEAAGSDVPAGEAAAQPGKPGVDFKMPLAAQPEAPLVETPKAGPAKLTAEAATVQSALAEMAGPTEGASAEGRPAQAAGASPAITSIFSAPLQPMTSQLAPAEAATATVQPGQTVDVALEQQLDLAHEGEWLDRLARDIARTAGAEGGLRFRLNPENLGSLHVELTQGQAGASLRLTAETEAARAIIADAQPRLVAEARAQGVRIAETHVDLGGHSASGEQRRQDAERPQDFVRTSPSSGATQENGDTPPAVNSSERYA